MNILETHMCYEQNGESKVYKATDEDFNGDYENEPFWAVGNMDFENDILPIYFCPYCGKKLE